MQYYTLLLKKILQNKLSNMLIKFYILKTQHKYIVLEYYNKKVGNFVD